MKVRIEKERHHTISDFGYSNARFYGYCTIDGKRIGTVWRFNDGAYVMNEDFNSRVHTKDNRPKQYKATNIGALRVAISEGR